MNGDPLSDFLLARITEDEEAFGVDPEDMTEDEWSAAGDLNEAWIAHVSKRMLAECAAKRRIVERCSAVDYAMPSTHLAHRILAEVASVYADHQDFREEWSA